MSTQNPATFDVLSLVSGDRLQHELLCRSIRRHGAEIERLTAQLAEMEHKQLARHTELCRLDAKILAAVHAEFEGPKI